MSRFMLTKLSSPGWDKEFDDEESLRNELVKYICNMCMEEDELFFNSSVNDLLATACGCEFWVEEIS